MAGDNQNKPLDELPAHRRVLYVHSEGFSALLMGTSAVLWRCPCTSPGTSRPYGICPWTKYPLLLSPVTHKLNYHPPTVSFKTRNFWLKHAAGGCRVSSSLSTPSFWSAHVKHTNTSPPWGMMSLLVTWSSRVLKMQGAWVAICVGRDTP